MYIGIMTVIFNSKSFISAIVFIYILMYITHILYTHMYILHTYAFIIYLYLYVSSNWLF